jgi:hypothetical protein
LLSQFIYTPKTKLLAAGTAGSADTADTPGTAGADGTVGNATYMFMIRSILNAEIVQKVKRLNKLYHAMQAIEIKRSS